ncbi:hypothetical protein ABIE06_003433 [Pantoea dispersa]|uniref:hypothetical protein n=1 Tax=Pantoea dispersa TaxID=59814 RepID=UPI003D25A337
MTERGMIFNAEMVRAVLDGSKTQTRRIIKLDHERGMQNPVVRGKNGEVSYVGCRLASMLCPFGQQGDRLWVREAFMNLKGTGIESTTGQFEGFAYRADTPPSSYGDMARKDYGLKWTPSIHMPRWASRITLEITNVGVQRLQSISQNDAAREGLVKLPATGRYCINQGDQYFGGASHDAREVFSWLWESIYGADSWQANPWVWVIEFKRVEVE